MTKKFIDISDKLDDPIKDLIFNLDKITSKLNIEIIIVGAFARDLILQYGYDIPVFRATTDFDFGIKIRDWDTFDILVKKLIEHKNFKKTDTIHRILFRDDIIIDLIPFGAIADKTGNYQWRDKNKTTINVTGFTNAYNTACIVRISSSPKIEMKFASIESQTVLKLISWNNSRDSRGKDAIDLVTLMTKHIDAGNEKRFFEEHFDITNDNQISWENNSARLLGRDVAKNTDKNTLHNIVNILSNELNTEISDLVIDMMKRNLHEFEYNEYYSLVNSFYVGIMDITKNEYDDTFKGKQ